MLTPRGLPITQTAYLNETNGSFRTMITILQKLKIALKIHSFSIPELESLGSSNGFEITESKIWDKKKAV